MDMRVEPEQPAAWRATVLPRAGRLPPSDPQGSQVRACEIHSASRRARAFEAVRHRVPTHVTPWRQCQPAPARPRTWRAYLSETALERSGAELRPCDHIIRALSFAAQRCRRRPPAARRRLLPQIRRPVTRFGDSGRGRYGQSAARVERSCRIRRIPDQSDAATWVQWPASAVTSVTRACSAVSPSSGTTASTCPPSTSSGRP